MALFATRQTDDVFPVDTYRAYQDTQNTGYLDEMRAASTCATGYSISKTGNMFLGIEDFIGYSYECLGGVKLSSTNIQTSLDYNTFSFSKTYTQADINLSSTKKSGGYISSLQESSSVPGLLMPKTTTASGTTYYCDTMDRGGVPLFQSASLPHMSRGVFHLFGSEQAADSSAIRGARLCGEPL